MEPLEDDDEYPFLARASPLNVISLILAGVGESPLVVGDIPRLVGDAPLGAGDAPLVPD